MAQDSAGVESALARVDRVRRLSVVFGVLAASELVVLLVVGGTRIWSQHVGDPEFVARGESFLGDAARTPEELRSAAIAGVRMSAASARVVETLTGVATVTVAAAAAVLVGVAWSLRRLSHDVRADLPPPLDPQARPAAGSAEAEGT